VTLGIQRVLAPNPGPMTLTGTNTYLVDDGAGHLAVIDPGPDEPHHVRATLEAAHARGGVITTILVTHRHLDHLPAATPLSAASGAVLRGHRDLPGVADPLADGERAFGPLVALQTPGHTRESLSFWDADTRALFTGDLVLGSSTTIVDDRPGALTEYLASIERLLGLGPCTIYPGHGPMVEDGQARLSEYRAHRQLRIQQVVGYLRRGGQATVDQLVAAIYNDVPATLQPMAARNVRASLDYLQGRGQAATAADGSWHLTSAPPNG
jgi:glyoxylase-like metal-dependent hydrolase (beta-lactamase superfamily II)